jgi:hypothetical protein
MSPKLQQVAGLLEEIEEIKRIMVITDANPQMPYVIKSKTLEEMRECLKQTQHFTLGILEEAMEELRDESSDGGGV